MSSHQLAQVGDLYTCVVCGWNWKRMPSDECPGVRRYRWDPWPEQLMTKNQLAKAGYQTGRRLPPVAGVIAREDSPGGWLRLYDPTQAVPKQPVTPRQQVALAKAQAARKCRECGRTLSRRERRLCWTCDARLEARYWAASVLQRGAVILDTETTGLDNAEIIELAVIDAYERVLLNTRIKPLCPERMYEVGSRGLSAFDIHGISAEMLVDAPTFAEVYPRLRRVVEGRPVLVYNLRFDRDRLREDCERWQLPALDFSAWDCAMEWYAQWIGEWSYRRGSFRWQPLNGGHDALGDCLACLDRMRRMANATMPRTRTGVLQ